MRGTLAPSTQEAQVIDSVELFLFPASLEYGGTRTSTQLVEL